MCLFCTIFCVPIAVSVCVFLIWSCLFDFVVILYLRGGTFLGCCWFTCVFCVLIMRLLFVYACCLRWGVSLVFSVVFLFVVMLLCLLLLRVCGCWASLLARILMVYCNNMWNFLIEVFPLLLRLTCDS